MRLTPEQFEAEEARRKNWRRGAQLGLLTPQPELEQAPDGTLTPKREDPPTPYESEVQRDVLAVLRVHPKVAWAKRMNSGAFLVGEPGAQRFVRAAFKGCADILGQMRDGRFLAVECKRAGEKPTPEQAAFLEHVRAHRGVAFVARSIDDVMQGLRAPP